MSQGARVLPVRDDASGLRAFIVLDDTTLGPAAGGIRTLPYPSDAAAIADARALARAMTLKCALGGLAAGGGKGVVIAHEGLDRPRAFAVLGRFIDDLDGEFRTAGDAGTTAADLAALATTCRYVHTEEAGLADSVARGLLRCLEAACASRGLPGPAGLRVAVQGCGAIGSAVARALAGAGAVLTLADLEPARAAVLAADLGAEVLDPIRVLTAGTDVLCPCALGGVVDESLASRTTARIICGGANNLLADPGVEEVLRLRGVTFVPDVLSSAGAVIDGIGQSVMGLPDRTSLIDALAVTTREILANAAETGRLASELALERAATRIGRGIASGRVAD